MNEEDPRHCSGPTRSGRPCACKVVTDESEEPLCGRHLQEEKKLAEQRSFQKARLELEKSDLFSQLKMLREEHSRLHDQVLRLRRTSRALEQADIFKAAASVLQSSAGKDGFDHLIRLAAKMGLLSHTQEPCPNCGKETEVVIACSRCDWADA